MKFFNKSNKTRKSIAVFLLLALLCSICIPMQNASAAAKAPLIILSKYSNTMKIGQEFYLAAFISDFGIPKYSSSSRSVASVDAYGIVTAKKAGSCKISVKSGKSVAYCKITVKKTQITLNKTNISMENGATFQLKASTTSGSKPTFKINKKSVAVIDDTGLVTALKPGEALITIKADQTEQHCKVKVKAPKITLSTKKCTLTPGKSTQIKAKVSSGRALKWSSSKSSVAKVDQSGRITAVKAGTATIKAKVDGVTATCTVTVTKE